MTSTTSSRFLLDTNVLLRIVSEAQSGEFGETLQQKLGVDAALCVAQQSLFEFWTVYTRPVSANGLDGTPTEAFRIIGLIRDAFDMLPDPEDLIDRWLNLCREHEIRGKPAHDARLIAVADAHVISQIVTFDAKHFQRFRHMRIVDLGDP